MRKIEGDKYTEIGYESRIITVTGTNQNETFLYWFDAITDWVLNGTICFRDAQWASKSAYRSDT